MHLDKQQALALIVTVVVFLQQALALIVTVVVFLLQVASSFTPSSDDVGRAIRCVSYHMSRFACVFPPLIPVLLGSPMYIYLYLPQSAVRAHSSLFRQRKVSQLFPAFSSPSLLPGLTVCVPGLTYAFQSIRHVENGGNQSRSGHTGTPASEKCKPDCPINARTPHLIAAPCNASSAHDWPF